MKAILMIVNNAGSAISLKNWTPPLIRMICANFWTKRRAKMSRLAQAFAEVEEHVTVFGHELKSLKEYVTFLEEENTRLKLDSVLSATDPALLQMNSSGIQRASIENLEKMYADFFHVCHLCFGEPRTEPCLFCEAFLRHDK
jgi:regulator of replication initiation timing